MEDFSFIRFIKGNTPLKFYNASTNAIKIAKAMNQVKEDEELSFKNAKTLYETLGLKEDMSYETFMNGLKELENCGILYYTQVFNTLVFNLGYDFKSIDFKRKNV